MIVNADAVVSGTKAAAAEKVYDTEGLIRQEDMRNTEINRCFSFLMQERLGVFLP